MYYYPLESQYALSTHISTWTSALYFGKWSQAILSYCSSCSTLAIGLFMGSDVSMTCPHPLNVFRFQNPLPSWLYCWFECITHIYLLVTASEESWFFTLENGVRNWDVDANSVHWCWDGPSQLLRKFMCLYTYTYAWNAHFYMESPTYKWRPLIVIHSHTEHSDSCLLLISKPPPKSDRWLSFLRMKISASFVAGFPVFGAHILSWCWVYPIISVLEGAGDKSANVTDFKD